MNLLRDISRKALRVYVRLENPRSGELMDYLLASEKSWNNLDKFGSLSIGWLDEEAERYATVVYQRFEARHIPVTHGALLEMKDRIKKNSMLVGFGYETSEEGKRTLAEVYNDKKEELKLKGAVYVTVRPNSLEFLNNSNGKKRVKSATSQK